MPKKAKSKLPKLLYPIKVQKPNWYGFDHKKVDEMFEGGLTFLNEFCVKDEYHPVAVYKVAKPNKEKGHKEYLLLNGSPHNCVRGMTKEEIEPFRYQSAVHCHQCNDIIYSVNRHHFIVCTCKATNVDGGKEYFKFGYTPGSSFKIVKLDLLTDEVVNET